MYTYIKKIFFNRKELFLMKYIFLDIDGVLNTKASWSTKPYDLDTNSISVLGDICKKTGAIIVLTSTWKTGFVKNTDKNTWTPQIQDLANKLSEVHLTIYDKTPDWKSKSRSDEVAAYLKRYPAEKYVILDDDLSLFTEYKNLYHVNCVTGLTNQDAKKIIKLLK